MYLFSLSPDLLTHKRKEKIFPPSFTWMTSFLVDGHVMLCEEL